MKRSNIPSSIPKSELLNRRRSSSVDCLNRGSYLSTRRRSASNERISQGSALKEYPRINPKSCLVSKILPHSRTSRASLLDVKGIRKDPRPLHDKSYQKQCVISLMEFLEQVNFPENISAKHLLNPTKRSFEIVFEFLYNYWDPKYKAHRIEEEIPKIMKSLSYPFFLNKSSFLTITRTTWPTLLGILMWLMELNKFTMSIDIYTYSAANDLESADKKTILYNYILQSYESGSNDPSKDEEVFKNLLSEPSEYSTEELLQLIEEKEAAIAKKDEELAEYDQLVEDNKQLESTIASYNDYFINMEKYIKQKDTECNALKEKKDAKEKELANLKKIVSEKESIYKSQGFDGQQAQNYYAVQKKNLFQKLDQKTQQFNKEEKSFWELQIEISHLSDKVGTLCQTFNESYANLRTALNNVMSPLKGTSIPAAVKLCRDYKIVLPEFVMLPYSHKTNYAVWKDEIKPALDRAKIFLDKQLERLQSIKGVQEQHLHEIQMKLNDVNIKQRLIDTKTTQKDHEMEAKKKEYQKEIKELEKQCEDLKKKFSESHNEIMKLEEIKTDLKKKKIELYNEKESNSQKYKEYREAVPGFFQRMEKCFSDSIKKREMQKAAINAKVEESIRLIEKHASCKRP